MDCIYHLLPLEEAKQKQTDSKVAGVSCKKPTSTSLPSPSPTPTPEEKANSTPYNTNYIIFGVLGSTTVIGVILLLV